jgi:LPXTG-site transpeptidase (sortase) family protein
MSYDPLEAFEANHPNKNHTKTKVLTKSLAVFKFLVVYLLVSGTLFSVLLGILNFWAYSERLAHIIDPERLEDMRGNLEEIIGKTSMEVHAEATNEEKETHSIIEEKLANTNPDIVWKRSYDAENLLANIRDSEHIKPTIDITPYENRLIIPKLWKNIPLLDVNHDGTGAYEDMHNIFMEELKKGIVRYPGTALPGEVGNTFIFGHSSNYPWIKSDYNDVFALLDTLQNGDEIIVFYNQEKFTYKVTDRAIVKPGEVGVIENRDKTKKELSLMTCWPIWTTLERLILFAELKE